MAVEFLRRHTVFFHRSNPTHICYNNPGVYDVTLITTNANGNDTLTLHNYITVNPTPPIPTITQVGYTLTCSAAFSYQWQLNAVAIPGATSQSYDVLQSGYYTVIVGDTNTCINSATQYVLISGIHDVESSAGVSIFPNPTTGNFTIDFSNSSINGIASIEVVNTFGQKVFSADEKVASATFKKQIDLSAAARGVYFVEIKTTDEVFTKKILITE